MAMNKLLSVMEPIFFTPPGKPWDKRLYKGGGAPPPPDPYAVANAQGQANESAARLSTRLNRYNESTPFGSSTWSQDANNPDAWSNQVTLDPRISSMVDAYYARTQQANPNVNFSSLPSAADGATYRAAAAPGINENRSQVAQTGQVALDSGNLMEGQINRLGRTYGTEMNFDSAPAMPTFGANTVAMPQADEAARNQVQDALYRRQTQMLDPRFSQEENALRSRLANQGITEGSEAYNREIQDWRQSKDQAYSNAMLDSITGGGAELQRLFGMGLAARQQDSSELGQRFSAGLAGREQGVNEAKYLRELPTQEALAAQSLYSGNSSVDNAARGTQLDQLRTHMALASEAQAQDERARASRLGEQMTAHNLPQQDRTQMLNELMALATGAQVQGPSGGASPVAASPVAQSIYNSYQGDLNNYNARIGQQNALIGAAGQTAGMAAMAFF